MKVYVCGGERQDGWADAMLQDLASSLEGGGADSEYWAFSEETASAYGKVVKSHLTDRIPFGLFSINRVPFGSMAGHQEIPSFLWLVDHFTQHVEQVAEVGGRCVVGCIDRRQLKVLQRFLPSQTETVFFPHAGPEPLASIPDMADRDIDLLFVGSLRANPYPENVVRHFGSSPLVRDVFVQAAYRCIDSREDCLTALVVSCTALGLAPGQIPFPTLCRMAVAVESCAEAYARYRCLASVASGRVHVVGQVSPVLFPNRAKLVFHGRKSFTEVLKLMERSRLVLSPTPKFRDGGHERIFYALSRGCGIVTSGSDFLEADFPANEAMFYLPDRSYSVATYLEVARRNPSYLRRMQAASLEVYRARHTWRSRVPLLLEALRKRQR